jgi:hypothetical protein
MTGSRLFLYRNRVVDRLYPPLRFGQGKAVRARQALTRTLRSPARAPPIPTRRPRAHHAELSLSTPHAPAQGPTAAELAAAADHSNATHPRRTEESQSPRPRAPRRTQGQRQGRDPAQPLPRGAVNDCRSMRASGYSRRHAAMTPPSTRRSSVGSVALGCVAQSCRAEGRRVVAPLAQMCREVRRERRRMHDLLGHPGDATERWRIGMPFRPAPHGAANLGRTANT